MTAATSTIPGMAARTLGYRYDQAGNRTRLTWPDASYYVNYTFDPLNRMTMATEKGLTTFATYEFNSLSQRTNLTYGAAGAEVDYTWTAEGDLTDLDHTTTSNPHYTLTYNRAHQLVSQTVSTSNFRYTPPTGPLSAAYAANNLNQYSSVGGQALSYDLNGNLTGDGVWSYAYDPENRLVNARKSGTDAYYTYDPLGRRTKKVVNGSATYFLNAGDDEVGEYGSSTTLLRRFVPGPGIDEPIAMVDWTDSSHPAFFFHENHEGSVIAMSDASGVRTEGPYRYDPHGNGAPTTGVPFKFTGRYLDAETGLYYYRARYYSPALGRFLQTDPIGYKDDLDLYTYVLNDPTNRTDPTGMVDDVTGGNWQVQAQLNTPEAQRAQIVTFAAGAPIIAATFVATTVASPFVASVAISTGAGGSISALSSAAHGNSNGQVLTDTGKGMASSAITSTAGRVAGIAGAPATVSGEIVGAYAGAKATGASNTEATVSAVAAGAVGLVTMPAGVGASTQASSAAGTFVRSVVKGMAKTEIKSAAPGCTAKSGGTTCH